MAEYSIFTLGESQITISGGGQLDGVTQGSGVHLQDLQITLVSDAWEEVQITDNDTNFQDSDGSQRLNGDQIIDDTPYDNGTVVEAEYALTLSDGINSWTVVGFNFNTSSPAYGTVEGLAFIGGPGGFPPTGVPLTVTETFEGPSFAAAAYATPICYDRGTLILTDRGARRIEDLRPGDHVQTADNGPQAIRWIDGRHVVGAGRFAPVEFSAGAWGAEAPLRVSQQHRVLYRGPWAELLFGCDEVFVPAIHLVNGRDVRLLSRVRAQYFHLLLDRHEVIFANGVASESLHCAAAQGQGEGSDLPGFFPALPDLHSQSAPLARRDLRRHEAQVLVAMIDAARRDVDHSPGLRHIMAQRAAG